MFQLKWLWHNMKGYHGRYIFALISTAIVAGTMLIRNIITSAILDDVFYPIQETGVVSEGLITSLITLVATLLIFGICHSLFEYSSIMTYEYCSQRLVYSLRRDLYKNMQIQDQSFYNQNRTGDLMTRLTGDMDMVRHVVAWVLRMSIDAITLFLTTTICFFIYDWLFALAMLAITPLICVFTVHFSKRVGKFYMDAREKQSALNTAAQENIAGNRVVKAFAREDYEIQKFDQKNAEYRDSNTKAALFWFKYGPYVEVLSQSLTLVVLLLGGVFLITGRITIGTFALFNSLTWTLSNPMRNIGMFLNDLQRFFASANKIIELYYAKPSIITRHDAKPAKERVKGEISFNNVSLTLNNTQILKDINLNIKAGETIAIMGPTGSGKTSLINLIPRFNDVDSGEILLDGENVTLWDLKSLRKAIGIATQDVFLFSDTVDGNIAYGNSEMSEEDVAKYAKIADVDFVNKLTDGFDTIIGERGTGLSGGQKQRIALARALAVEPSVLILDDTTSAVDLETEQYIQHGLSNLDFDCTKIIVAQRISTAKRADRIAIIENGEITELGTHEELSKKEGYYREVFLLQNGEEVS